MYLYFSFPLTLSSTILPTNPSPLSIHYSPYLSLTSPPPLFSLPVPHLSPSTILPTSPHPLFSLTSFPATTSPLLLHYSPSPLFLPLPHLFCYTILSTNSLLPPSLTSSTYLLPMAPYFSSQINRTVVQ